MTQQRFSTPNPLKLEIKVAAGNIRVESVDGDQSTVALDGPDKLIEAMTVELTGDRLVIEQRHRLSVAGLRQWRESIRVRAQVPHHSRVDLVTAAADATLDGTFDGLGAQSASGDVSVVGELDGDADVKTVSGDVRLPHVAGDVTMQTVSGNVDAESVGGSVVAKSVSGDVRVRSVREGQVKVQSVSGDVELGIAAGTSVDVDAGSASGDLSSDVPLSSAPGGGEGPTVVIRSSTVSGDFRVFRAA
jgi:DUF4097 and DUF4098 domain-containing protein YvlB